MTAPARLTWKTAEYLSPEAREQLLGEGAPYEIVVEDVLGTPMEVFRDRMPNLPFAFARAAERWGDEPFLVTDAGSRTFREALDDAYAVARYLREEHGITKGDRVAIVAATCPEYLVVGWGIICAGAILTGLNGWWTAPEMVHGIELTEPKLVIGDAKRLERLEELGTDVGVPVLEITDFMERARQGGPAEAPDVELHEDDPVLILFTSGTTGRPKGATLSHRGFLHFGKATQTNQVVGSVLQGGPAEAPTRGASIAASPMFHISGLTAMLIQGPQNGNTLVFPPPGRWDETKHLELTQQHGITAWSGVPTQFWRIIEHPDLEKYDLSSVTTVGGGGAVFPPELIRQYKEKLPWISFGMGYGMSESCGMGTGIGGVLLDARPEAVGLANPTVQIEIRDPSGTVALPEGEVGEIHMRHAAIFIGYWNNEKATAEVLDADRWYRTGDFGRISDGLLVLESRMRDLIIRGGENIYPIEIENRLVEHPDIEDAAVIGVDHHQLGQEVKAFVVLREGASLTEDDVRDWVAQALAKFKVPAHVAFRDSLPYTLTGKVMKHELEKEERGEGPATSQA